MGDWRNWADAWARPSRERDLGRDPGQGLYFGPPVNECNRDVSPIDKLGGLG
jgi:hypothetical protein